MENVDHMRSAPDDPAPAAPPVASRARACEHCGREVRWVRNLGGRRHDSALQVLDARAASTAAFEADVHRGLVAVYQDGTGFTVSRHTTWVSLEGASLHHCHWDVCAGARADRDRISRERAVLGYAARPVWRRSAAPDRAEAADRAAADATARERFTAWLSARDD